MHQMKAQSTVEFLTTYAWAMTIIALFIAVVLVVVGFKSPASYTPASCYITPNLQCQSALFQSNGASSDFVIIFLNNLGTAISFPTNGIGVMIGFSGTTYTGLCYPTNAPVGATVICNATLAGFVSSVGGQANPNFAIYYHICDGTTCPSSVYNTSGFATGIVSPYKANVIDKVTLDTSLSGGKIDIGGITYPSGTVVYMINGQKTQLYAVPPAGHTFNSWVATGGVTFSTSNTLQTTNATANAAGTVNALMT